MYKRSVVKCSVSRLPSVTAGGLQTQEFLLTEKINSNCTGPGNRTTCPIYTRQGGL